MKSDQQDKIAFTLEDIRAIRLLAIAFGIVMVGFGIVSKGEGAVMILAGALMLVMLGASLCAIYILRRRKAAKAVKD